MPRSKLARLGLGCRCRRVYCYDRQMCVGCEG